MLYTTQQLIPGVRTLLRRPSEAQLSDSDIKEQIQDELSGLVQDMDLSDRPVRTESAFLELNPDVDEIDFLVTVPNVADFEAERLEYGTMDTTGHYSALTDDILVDFRNFADQARQGRAVASFYSSGAQSGQLKMRTSVRLDAALNGYFRLWYRTPLLSIVQMGQKPPIPSNFMPMVKYGVAIRCFPIVKNNSPEWRIFKQETLPLYLGEYRMWNNPDNLVNPGKWRSYLEKSLGSQIQRLPRGDDHRRRSNYTTRGVMPRGRPQ